VLSELEKWLPLLLETPLESLDQQILQANIARCRNLLFSSRNPALWAPIGLTTVNRRVYWFCTGLQKFTGYDVQLHISAGGYVPSEMILSE
jgi:hypothetical protein